MDPTNGAGSRAPKQLSRGREIRYGQLDFDFQSVTHYFVQKPLSMLIRVWPANPWAAKVLSLESKDPNFEFRFSNFDFPPRPARQNARAKV